jgi:hypothetical protein
MGRKQALYMFFSRSRADVPIFMQPVCRIFSGNVLRMNVSVPAAAWTVVEPNAAGWTVRIIFAFIDLNCCCYYISFAHYFLKNIFRISLVNNRLAAELEVSPGDVSFLPQRYVLHPDVKIPIKGYFLHLLTLLIGME